MITALINTLPVPQIYNFESEDSLSSFIQSSGVSDENWAILDTEKFSDVYLWTECLEISGNPSKVSLNLSKAKDSSLKLLEDFYSTRKLALSRKISPTEMVIELSLPEGERNPEVQKVVEELSSLRSQLHSYKSDVENSTNSLELANIIQLARRSWGVQLPGILPNNLND